MIQLLTPAKAVTLLKTILEREQTQPQGMPDPSDTKAPAEIERQKLAERLSDPDFVIPARGCNEHKQLVSHLARLLTKHPDLSPTPSELFAPVRPLIEPELILGILMVPREPIPPIEIPRR